MNKERFLIIDDDPGVCSVIENIIEDYDLGELIDVIHDGVSGINLIPKFKPDIVFVDFLLPDIDGVEIVDRIKNKYDDIDFIMISQVSDEDMISDAYESGIEFYISKPINVIEVISVTKRVIESQRNRRVLKEIGKTLNQNQTPTIRDDSRIEKVRVIFAELGILSEKGGDDIIELFIMQKAKNYQVSSIYRELSKIYELRGVKKAYTDKAIEQRVRRTIQTAMINVAHLGIEDFSNARFDRFASILFAYQDVKKLMDSIRKKERLKATVNVKHFLRGLEALIDRY